MLCHTGNRVGVGYGEEGGWEEGDFLLFLNQNRSQSRDLSFLPV